MDHMPDVQERPALRPRLCGAAVLAALGAALSGCVSGSVAVLNALEPAGGVAITRDIPYAENAPSGGGRHALDVYAPRNPRPGAPVVVFFYGGGWDSGNKGDYRFVGAALAAHGYLAIVPDYRLYPQVGYPDFLRDCALAVRWAKDHARDYGYDPETLFLMGHSAGAYNAVMLEVDPQWLNAVGLDSRRDIRGVAALAGPYDFLPLKSDTLKRIFGPEETRLATQPINHVTGGEAPMFLAHDLGDKVVYVKNTQNMAAKLKTVGDIVETHYYTGLNHALLMGAVATPLRFLAPVFKDLVAFIDAHTSAQPAKEKAAA